MSDHRREAEAWILQADDRWSTENSINADLSAIAAALIGIGHALLAQQPNSFRVTLPTNGLKVVSPEEPAS